MIAGTTTAEPVQFTLTANEDLDTPIAATFIVGNGSIANIAGTGASFTIDVTRKRDSNMKSWFARNGCGLYSIGQLGRQICNRGMRTRTKQ